MKSFKNSSILKAGLACLALSVTTGAVKAGYPFTLTAADVQFVLQQGTQGALVYNPNSVIAVTDREGFVLAVYGVSGPPNHTTVINAINKAVTAAFLSSTQDAFTSRTAGFIIQPHFPPGITNTAPGPLTGVGFSNLSFSPINHGRNPFDPGMGISGTSLSGMPGGVPLYNDGVLVGAVGVDSSTSPDATVFVAGYSVDEQIAMVAQSGMTPGHTIVASQVLINGIRFPYSDSPNGSLGLAGLNPANFAPHYPLTASPGIPYNPSGTTPYPLPAPPGFPGGEVRDVIRGSPYGSLVSGQPRLTQAEVTNILLGAADEAAVTRGAIRNPPGVASQNFIVVVDYYQTDGGGNPIPPTIPIAPPSPNPYPYPRSQVLGSFRTHDATFFSYDVAAQKAFTALFFSNNNYAISSRGVGFLAQVTFPPGIDGTPPGPYYGLQQDFSAASPTNANASINPFLPDGITIFPGGFPLYRNGVLIGAIGVSGDGVDQDDLISAAGTVNFEAPTAIRSDHSTYQGATIPYAKFPENAGL